MIYDVIYLSIVDGYICYSCNRFLNSGILMYTVCSVYTDCGCHLIKSIECVLYQNSMGNVGNYNIDSSWAELGEFDFFDKSIILNAALCRMQVDWNYTGSCRPVI